MIWNREFCMCSNTFTPVCYWITSSAPSLIINAIYMCVSRLLKLYPTGIGGVCWWCRWLLLLGCTCEFSPFRTGLRLDICRSWFVRWRWCWCFWWWWCNFYTAWWWWKTKSHLGSLLWLRWNFTAIFFLILNTKWINKWH